MVSGKLLETHAASPVSSELPNVRGAEFPQWWSTQPLSLRFRITKTSPNAVSNQRPFELGDASKNCKNHFPGGSARVDLFPKRNECDFQLRECFQCPQQMRRGPGEPREIPDRYHIESASMCLRHKLIELGSGVLSAGDAPVHIFVEYPPATALAVVPQLADLHRWVLTVVC